MSKKIVETRKVDQIPSTLDLIQTKSIHLIIDEPINSVKSGSVNIHIKGINIRLIQSKAFTVNFPITVEAKVIVNKIERTVSLKANYLGQFNINTDPAKKDKPISVNSNNKEQFFVALKALETAVLMKTNDLLQTNGINFLRLPLSSDYDLPFEIVNVS